MPGSLEPLSKNLPASGEKPKISAAKYNAIDKLAFALFSAGAAAGIASTLIILLFDKPLAVYLLLAALVGCLIFPIIHFIKSKLLRILAFSLLIAIILAGVMIQKNKDQDCYPGIDTSGSEDGVILDNTLVGIHGCSGIRDQKSKRNIIKGNRISNP